MFKWRCMLCGYFLLYLAFAGGFIVITGQANWLDYELLARQGVKARAYVTQINCLEHSTFQYKFEVGGKEYSAVGNDGFDNPKCRVLQVGDAVTIYYLPSDPSKSVAGNILLRLKNETVSILLASLILPVVAVFVIYLMRRELEKRDPLNKLKRSTRE